MDVQSEVVQPIKGRAKEAVESAMVELLETKHLYQPTKVETARISGLISSLKSHIETVHEYPKKVEKIMVDMLRELEQLDNWSFEVETHSLMGGLTERITGVETPRFFLRRVRIYCKKCRAIEPFKSGHKGFAKLFIQGDRLGEGFPGQIFALPFQCQNCEGEPVWFIVRREGLKLTLVGRSQFEQVVVPKYIPEGIDTFYSEALIAYQSKRTLAALFYLRTLIEQFIRITLSITERLRGDELCERYSATLEEDFKSRFGTLKKEYDDLSGCLHAAKEDDDVFKECLQRIELHFDGRQIFAKLPRSLPSKPSTHS